MPDTTKKQASAGERTMLVLQGGGALGAYQAGAYEALAERPLGWVAGISIGAINAALIAGNPPARRVQRLQEFWKRVSLALPLRPDPAVIAPVRGWWDDVMAWWGATMGVPGFFAPRPPLAWWPEPPESWYDTTPLRETLLELVDFELLNHGPMRFSVGAVDVQSGNFTYFDNRRERIAVEHVMASGALPPGFGAVQVDGRWYWDGGLVSNTPLAYVMEQVRGHAGEPVTIFQIDLFSARGELPGTLADAAEREKDIRYSSRTRFVSDLTRERHEMHQRLQRLAALLPEAQQKSREVHELLRGTTDPAVTLVHVIHRRKSWETQTKDYEFSELTMGQHWRAGGEDMAAALAFLAHHGAPQPGAFRVLDHQREASMARPQPAMAS